MYLLFLAEQGLVGGALYLSFIFIILARGLRLARHGASRQDSDLGAALVLFGVFYAVIGWFSHTLLEEPQTLFLLAFLFSGAFDVVTQEQTTGVPRAEPSRG
jgi:O-antigen ligase